MREKYESLALKELKAVAKARGLKNISTLKKADLVDRMVAEDEKEQGNAKQQSETVAIEASESTAQSETAVNAEQHETGDLENAQTADRPIKKRTYQKHTDTDGREHQPRKAIAKKPKAVKTEDGRPQKKARHDKSETFETATTANSVQTDATDSIDAQQPENEKKFEGVPAHGILEIMTDGYGFMRGDNYLPSESDVYVSPTTIRRYNLKTGDMITGYAKVKNSAEKFAPLIYISYVNGIRPDIVARRKNFEDMTPIFPNERIRLENPGGDVSMRIVDLVSPVGKGQRGMIVSPPKAGKTTLLKQIAKAVLKNAPDMHMIILLIDERPEEVTDMKEAIKGPNVEVIYSTFDELPEHHKRVSEMVMERAKRLVESRQDVIILLDSITRLARAYNLLVPPSGRTLSGGIDPAALHMPKKFFGAARNMREGGSLTILATALVDTGSKMDDVVYEEFKGTGNMELVLDRKLSEKRVFPALDIVKSSTRREDLLLDNDELEAVNIMRKSLNGLKTDEAVESILNLFARTDNNRQFVGITNKRKF